MDLSAFTDEVVDEVLGVSPRRWALVVLLIVVLSGVVALSLTRRSMRREAEATAQKIEPDALTR
jgi:hypothetical protein